MKNVHVAILGGIAALTAIYLINKTVQGGATVLRSIGDQVDPTNPENIAYSGVNKVGAILSGDDSGNWTLGGWVYDVTHPEFDPNAPVKQAEFSDPYSDPMGYYYP